MNGEIVSYTIIRTPPTGFDGAPYCVAIVDTDSKRVTARVAGYQDGQQIQVGDKVVSLSEADEYGATFSFIN
ncbi:Zn-ribbon domain-containing OB-fold protein [Corynebacterium sp. L4756]|uniref:Zn-ribbon domain-containing OB-fold protein n=1 Tax=unclassified Corynebacterium TaxID=2624378 RepID=UPI00374D2159